MLLKPLQQHIYNTSNGKITKNNSQNDYEIVITLNDKNYRGKVIGFEENGEFKTKIDMETKEAIKNNILCGVFVICVPILIFLIFTLDSIRQDNKKIRNN